MFKQQIKVNSDVAVLLASGKKSATTRKGIKFYTLGQVGFRLPDGSKPFDMCDCYKITKIELIRFNEIDDNLARIEGYKSSDELVEKITQIYGKCYDSDEFTVIYFEPT